MAVIEREDRSSDLASRAVDRKSLRSVTDLRWWAAREWTGGVELESLGELDTFAVDTLNSRYEFIVLKPRSGQVLVRGGQFFPEFHRIYLAGASLGGGCLKVHAIYPGFLMELVDLNRTIVTTAVQAIWPCARHCDDGGIC